MSTMASSEIVPCGISCPEQGMQARPYVPEDYPTVREWWPAHGWSAVPEPVLPKCGVVVEEDGTPLAVAWLYMDNSVGVSMMEWTVTNPTNTPKKSWSAVRFLCGAIRQVAESLDYGVMLTSVKQSSLCRIYERSGFTKTDEGMTHLIMKTRAA